MDTNEQLFVTLAETLAETLERTAERIVEDGTQSESWILGLMASAAYAVCPGAATALVDWHGSEVARLRAFGIVHGAILRSITPGAQEHLPAAMRGDADLALAG